MMTSAEALLMDANRCVLAYRDSDGPALTPVDCWSDGGGIWLTTSRRAAETTALRREQHCTVWLAPATPSEAGVAIDGSARIHDPADPVGLLLHAPTISAALAALALTHRSAIAGYVRHVPRVPAAWMPHDRVLIRIRIDRARRRLAPQHVTGVGPVLPADVPAGVRRALTGERHVTVALQRGDALVVQPAVWGRGFQVDMGTSVLPDVDAPASILVGQHLDAGPASRVALLLRGSIDGGGRFRPARATWWEGFTSGSATLGDAAATSGIVLPD
jgi:hypothetical protein